MREILSGQGVSMLTHPDGQKEKVVWQQISIESRGNIYTIRKYSYGHISLIHNCQVVQELPKGRLTTSLFAEALSRGMLP